MINIHTLYSRPADLDSKHSRRRILETIKNTVRNHLQPADVDLSKRLRIKPSSSIKPIRPIKPIVLPKPFTKLDKLKKKWDPDHTSLAWKD